eukprot:m.347098 g.347098  ORF g.347098 m.347098 type:complete len:376 (+) comp31314_c0_seq1:211-1338(+)
MVAIEWGPDYGQGIGGIIIVRGTGIGQSRRILNLSTDNVTLILDKPFAIPPDSDSVMVLFSESIHAATIRDNVMFGIPEHVDQDGHTATVMIPLWGRADKVTYINNIGQDIRTTLYAMVEANLTITDHIVQNSVSIHTRNGLDIFPTPMESRLSLLVTVQNMTLRNVVEAGIRLQASCETQKYESCTGFPAGGFVVQGLHVNNASNGLAVYKNGWTPGAGRYNNFTGNGLGAMVIDSFNLSQLGNVTYVEDSAALPWFINGSIASYNTSIIGPGSSNVTAVPVVLTPIVFKTTVANQASWSLHVTNVGLDDGVFEIAGLGPDFQTFTQNMTHVSSWKVDSSQVIHIIVVTSKAHTACGTVLSKMNPNNNDSFCLI